MSLLVQLLIAIIPAIISGLVAYYKSKNDMQAKIMEIKTRAESEIKRVEKDYEGKIKHLQEQTKSNLEYYKGKLEADSKKTEKDHINDLTSKLIHNMLDDRNNDLENLTNLKKWIDKNN